MPSQKTVNQFDVGDELEPGEIDVSAESNRRYCEALEDHNPRYFEGSDGHGPWVHPGLHLNQSNPTKSASHVLPEGMANVHAKDEVEFFAPGRVGKKFRLYWKVLEKYTKRGRQYMVFRCQVVDEDGIHILRRRMTSTFIQGGA